MFFEWIFSWLWKNSPAVFEDFEYIERIGNDEDN